MSEALRVAAAAIAALPCEEAMTIFLGASGSSTRHIAQVLQAPVAQVEATRARINAAFVMQARERLKAP